MMLETQPSPASCLDWRHSARISPRWLLVFCLASLPLTGSSQDVPAELAVAPPAYRPDQILLQPKAGIRATELAVFHSAQQSEVLGTFAGIGGLQIVRLPAGETVPGFIAKCKQSDLVEFAEPDYLIHAALTPNDPKFVDGTLWGLHNTGQSGGTTDADIDAPEAWDVLVSASNIVVAVLDTGIRLTHEDLAANLWTNVNSGGHGLNAFTGSTNASDDEGHGTLTAGMLGAVGNNGKGIAGVAWRVQMMSCKCLDAAGNGSDATLITCIDFARTNGARVMNASLDSPGASLAVSNAIYAARNDGIIFVASAGNSAANVDATPRYPAGYHIDNIVSVAATTRTDELWSSSNYGETNVDLAAPGHQIYSSFFISDSFYLGPLSGTSLAAPQVAGAFALMLNKHPTETHQQIIARLLDATDPVPALAGKCLTGGRLNLHKALSPPLQLTSLSTAGNFPFALRVNGGPHRSCVIEITTNLTLWSPLVTNTTSAGGTFDFTDDQSTSTAQRFYRAVAAP